MAAERDPARAWLDYLSDEDVTFIRRFMLASGSLKEVARIYGISYPTVRLRLDRLIEKIKLLDDQSITSEFERVLRAQFAEGSLEMRTVRTLLRAHRREMKRGGGR